MGSIVKKTATRGRDTSKKEMKQDERTAKMTADFHKFSEEIDQKEINKVLNAKFGDKVARAAREETEEVQKIDQDAMFRRGGPLEPPEDKGDAQPPTRPPDRLEGPAEPPGLTRLKDVSVPKNLTEVIDEGKTIINFFEGLD